MGPVPISPPPDGDDDAELVDACGETASRLCRWVFEGTDNSTLAELSDWFVSRPLTILLIIGGAWLLAWFARRAIHRLTYRLVAPDPRIAEAMNRVRVGRAQDAIDSLLRDPRRHARATAMATVMGSTAAVVIWSMAVILILGEMGVNLGPIIAGAGIAGVALGFGAQSLVQDCLAGLFILIEDQFGIGDVVDLGEATGVVEQVTLRATVLRSVDGVVWHVPNGQVQRVGNHSQLWSVALVDVDVAYGADLERARTLIHQAADEVCGAEQYARCVLEPPQVTGVEVLGADRITLRLLVKTAPGEQFALQRALRATIKATLDSHGIEIPFPQRTVWMRVDPDRT